MSTFVPKMAVKRDNASIITFSPVPGPFERSGGVPERSGGVPGRLLGSLGASRGPLGDLLGSSWGVPGPPEGVLGASWGALGAIFFGGEILIVFLIDFGSEKGAQRGGVWGAKIGPKSIQK